ncbi:tyrosine-type recombinase/integrase [Kocuria marina]|uniref:tyrosine-type recombinase/integrase n=1 Tax=Kocuria marina TaxID=223184 RepID=UPI00164295D5|nr:tyrosine-type recombinase/integrase [Kocuria indica]
MTKHRARRRADAQQVLDEFVDWLLRERSVQANTASVYADRIVGFVGWLPAPVEESLSALTPTKVLEWVNLEAKQPRKPSTLRKQLVMLRSFLGFCHRTGRIDTDFSAVVPHAAGWRLSSIPDPVPEGTIQAVLDSLDERSPKGLRDRAVLLLLTGLGLRSGEIAGLRLSDIGWRAGTLRVTGKGDRVDELPLPEEVGRALEEYVLHGRGGRIDSDRVFMTMFEPLRPLTADGVAKIVRMACARAGVTEFGPHRLRHTFATGTLAAGATLQEVQALLRHAQLRTTAIYTKVDRARLTQLAPTWPAAAESGWKR